MRYRSQSVAYWYFAVAMVLFGLQLVFGLLSAAKYLGPDPLLYILPFDVTKVIHTNLLIVWVLTGFMGATYWMVPDESRTELYSVKLAYVQLVLWTLMGVTAVVGYLFRYGTGNKLLEQPLPHKLVIVVCMLMFLYNVGMTIWKSGRFTTTEGVLLLGMGCAAVLYLPALLRIPELHGSNLLPLVDHPPVGRGRVGDDPGRLPGLPADPPVGCRPRGDGKVALRDRGPGLHRRHPGHRAPLLLGRRAGVLAAHRRHLQRAGAAGPGRHGDLRVLGDAPIGPGSSEHAGVALDGRQRRVHALRRGAAGLAHTLPDVNKWTHGTLITAMHGHAAFYGAYAMIMLAMITYALPAMTPGRHERGSGIGYWAFWLQIGGMFGMTLSFATAGIAQVYLERILGMGYLDAQFKIQVHFVMLVITGSIFAIGVGCSSTTSSAMRPASRSATRRRRRCEPSSADPAPAL